MFIPDLNSFSLDAVVWQVLSMVCVVCSMLSKEQGITALGFCIVYDFISSSFSQVRAEGESRTHY